MALCEISDYPNEFEQFKAGVNYGFAVPTQYPLGISGLSATQETWFYATPQPLPDAAHNLVQLNPLESGSPSSGSPTNQGAGLNAPKPGSIAETIQQVIAALTPAIAQVGGAISKNRKAPKRVVVEQKTDYTQMALIGGGILVAALLAITVGKSSRRKE